MRSIRIGKSSIDIMSKKDLRMIQRYVEKQFGVSLPPEFAYLKSAKDNLYMVNSSLSELPIPLLRINSIGLYLGEITKGEFRLSIEGSQLLGPKATKGVVELNAEELQQWIRGEPVAKKTIQEGYVLVRCGNDYVGCSRVKNEYLLNFVPKTRRVKELA